MSTRESLKAGQLVRYLESSSRWWFALLRRVRADDVELAFFDGSPQVSVSRLQIETLDSFLGMRERKFSRTRSQLTEFFYGRVFVRLPESRLQEMRQTLQKAGITFHPEDWPTANTRIQLWCDGSFVQPDSIAPELDALLPQWLEPFVLPSGSRDPLGLQAPAEKLVNEVLPGLTVFTSRAGYYGFLTWAIRYVNGMSPDKLPGLVSRREVLNSFERALALCEFVYHGREDNRCRLIGQHSKLRVLSSHEADRYRVPASILKNQDSAGSFRLFSTSLVSLGLVEEDDELAADGLLAFRLTALGDELAGVFHKQVDAAFVAFAMGKRKQSRDVLRAWGKSLCFSSIARKAAYRKRLLRGLLLGNSLDTEKRYRTVSLLFSHGLFQANRRDNITSDNLNEEDAAVLGDEELEEEVYGAGISNLKVVLHFYGCAPSKDLIALQSLATFELLSLGLSAIFRAAVASITGAGKADLAGLSRSIATEGELASLWQTPMQEAKPKTVRKLVAELRGCPEKNATRAASIGGALLLRVIRDPLLPAVWDVLTQMAQEPVELVDRCLREQMNLSLEAALPGLFRAMIERHEVVSQRKNRQRWLFLDGDLLVRDDPQEMGLGLHSLRFPQLGSLAYDMDLSEEDLRDG